MARLALIYASLPVVAATLTAVAPLEAYGLRASARDWIPTQAEVTSSDFFCSYGRRGGAVFRVRVLYRYEVGDRLQLGDTVMFGDGTFETCIEAESVAKALPIGSTPTAFVEFVDPKHPGRAVLYRERVGSASQSDLIVACFFFVVGVVLGTVGWQRDRRNAGALRTANWSS